MFNRQTPGATAMTKTELLAVTKKSIRTMTEEQLSELRAACEAFRKSREVEYRSIFTEVLAKHGYTQESWDALSFQEHLAAQKTVSFYDETRHEQERRDASPERQADLALYGHGHWRVKGGTDLSSLLISETRRRRTNESRELNTADRAANVVTLKLAAGDRCHVHAFGHWYQGEVVRLAKTGGKVLVRYTSGTGVTREKLVGADKVRA